MKAELQAVFWSPERLGLLEAQGEFFGKYGLAQQDGCSIRRAVALLT
jgi:hypothetical protein